MLHKVVLLTSLATTLAVGANEIEEFGEHLKKGAAQTANGHFLSMNDQCQIQVKNLKRDNGEWGALSFTFKTPKKNNIWLFGEPWTNPTIYRSKLSKGRDRVVLEMQDTQHLQDPIFGNRRIFDRMTIDMDSIGNPIQFLGERWTRRELSVAWSKTVNIRCSR